MCDTLVALPHVTKSGSLILGKNSDREPLEAQAIVHVPQTNHQESQLQCTYISIPQVELTYEVILSKPFQMWGAEMGANEHGTVIGNEAVFTNVKFDKKQVGLTGMDLLRLGLERGKTAKEALHVIIDLLQTYGQNACGGYQNTNFYYHNSFLIADTQEALILETAGKSWACRAVDSIGSISNGLTIEENYLEAHFEKEPRNIQHLFSGSNRSFRGNFSDVLYTTAGKSKQRQACTLSFLEKRNKPGVEDFFQALRQHDREDFHPKKATTGCICMHATGFTNPSDTTGSMVAEIRKDGQSTIWLTGSSHPCMSLYLPFYFGIDWNHDLFSPTAHPDQSLWWRVNKIQQGISKNYPVLQPKWKYRLDHLQSNLIVENENLLKGNPDKQKLSLFMDKCLNDYLEVIRSFEIE